MVLCIQALMVCVAPDGLFHIYAGICIEIFDVATILVKLWLCNYNDDDRLPPGLIYIAMYFMYVPLSSMRMDNA